MTKQEFWKYVETHNGQCTGIICIVNKCPMQGEIKNGDCDFVKIAHSQMVERAKSELAKIPKSKLEEARELLEKSEMRKEVSAVTYCPVDGKLAIEIIDLMESAIAELEKWESQAITERDEAEKQLSEKDNVIRIKTMIIDKDKERIKELESGSQYMNCGDCQSEEKVKNNKIIKLQDKLKAINDKLFVIYKKYSMRPDRNLDMLEDIEEATEEA